MMRNTNPLMTPLRKTASSSLAVISAITILSDDRFMAILTYQGGEPYGCTILDLKSGKQHLVAESKSELLGGTMALNPGASIVALETRLRDIQLWSTSEDTPLHTLHGEALIDPLSYPIPFRFVDSMGFSPDGRYLAAGFRGGRVKRWNVKTGQPLATLAFSSGFSSVDFSSRGLLAIVNTGSPASGRKLLTIWEFTPVDSEPKHRVISAENMAWARAAGAFTGLAFSGDGRTLAVTTEDSDGNASVGFYNSAFD